MTNKKQQLSARERQVVAEIQLGKTNVQIAESLGLAKDTVDSYLRRIRSKLQLTSKLQIGMWAAKEFDSCAVSSETR